MNDKKLLIILVLLSIYILVVRPMNSKLQEKGFLLRNTERLIEKENFINKESKKIEATFPKYIKIINKNNSYFFPKNMSKAEAMGIIQKIIKEAASYADLEAKNISWDASIDKKYYEVLPISIIVIGFYSFSLMRYGNNISVNAIVSGFKLKYE